MQKTTWNGMYSEPWRAGTDLYSESMSHPAKASKKLLRQIFEHLLTSGYIRKGDTCLDPFFGVGTTAIVGGYFRIQIIGCELESRFVAMSKANVELHRHKWEVLGMPMPVILRGDSRNLVAILGQAGISAVVSSPPYADGGRHQGGKDSHPEYIEGGSLPYVEYGTEEGQLGQMPLGELSAVISSPPYVGSLETQGGIDPTKSIYTGGPHSQMNRSDTRYGITPGHLSAMKKGKFDMVVSSPPYVSGGHHPDQTGSWGGQAQSVPKDLAGYGDTAGQIGKMPEGQLSAVISSPSYAEAQCGGELAKPDAVHHDGHTLGANSGYKNQDEAEGQLTNLPAGPFDLVCNSPPYVKTMSDSYDGIKWRQAKTEGGSENYQKRGKSICGEYGRSEGQLGNVQGDTFWSAARQILEQCYSLLKPGGHATWIVKRFCRNGAIVPFDEQWRYLCEHVGFVTVEVIHALLVEKEEEDGLFGPIIKTKAKKSFFRRLYEKKRPDNAIDWETVYIMVKTKGSP